MNRASLLQRFGAWIGGTVGRDSLVVRTVRPVYEALLDRTSGGKGYLATINGTERFYVNPRYRAWFGETYEPEAFAYLKERVQPDSIVLNVGAHVGIYAMSLAAWVGRSGRVFALSPIPARARFFRIDCAQQSHRPSDHRAERRCCHTRPCHVQRERSGRFQPPRNGQSTSRRSPFVVPRCGDDDRPVLC